MRRPRRLSPRGGQLKRVALLTGCVQDAFFAHVNRATARVLAAHGCEVLVPPLAELLRRARDPCRTRATRAASGCATSSRRWKRLDIDHIVVNSAGCGSAMKEYGALLADDPFWAARAAQLLGTGARRHGGACGARGAAALRDCTRCPRGSRITMRVTSRTRRECARSRAAVLASHPRSRARRPARSRTSAAAAPASTTSSRRRRLMTSALARRRTSSRAAPSCSPPATAAACSRSRRRCGVPGIRYRRCTPWSCSTRPSADCPVAAAHRPSPSAVGGDPTLPIDDATLPGDSSRPCGGCRRRRRRARGRAAASPSRRRRRRRRRPQRVGRDGIDEPRQRRGPSAVHHTDQHRVLAIHDREAARVARTVRWPGRASARWAISSSPAPTRARSRCGDAWELQRSLGVDVRVALRGRRHREERRLSMSTDCPAATFCAGDGIIDPHGVVSALWAECRRLDTTFVFDTEVLDVEAGPPPRVAPRPVISRPSSSSTPPGRSPAPSPQRRASTCRWSHAGRNLACTEPVHGIAGDIPMCVDNDTGVLIRREGAGFLIGFSDPSRSTEHGHGLRSRISRCDRRARRQPLSVPRGCADQPAQVLGRPLSRDPGSPRDRRRAR